MLVLLLSTQINLDHTLVVLHFIHCAFAENGALVQHGNFAGNLADEDHVMLDDNDAVFAGEADEQLAGLGCFAMLSSE